MRSTRQRSHVLSIVLAGLLGLSACNNTEISRSYVHPDLADLDLNGVLVVAITQRQKARVKFEDDFVRSLRRYGVHAVASHTVVPQDEASVGDIIAAAVSADADTILITRYIDEFEETIYHPGKVYYGVSPVYGRSHYNRFEDYYNHAHEVAYQHPVWSPNVTHILVSDLYVASGRKHLWQAVSETLEAGSSEQLRDNAVKGLIGNLKEQGLIH